MTKTNLIQKIIDRKKFDRYLEIGCQKGYSFLPVRCRYKTAVDPVQQVSISKKFRWLLKNPSNVRNRYFTETSDAFFANHRDYLARSGKIGVALVDGLHTYGAALQDVLNILPYLHSDGVIVMHDCFPPHKAAAMDTEAFPDREEQRAEGWNGDWCGDVWKSIVYLRKHLSDCLDIFVLDTDYGLGVVRMKKDLNACGLKIDPVLFNEIKSMSYDEMVRDAPKILNLKGMDYAETFLAGI